MQGKGYPGVTFFGPKQANQYIAKKLVPNNNAPNHAEVSSGSGADAVQAQAEWTFESLRHMGEPHIYEEHAPDGYTEHITFDQHDKIINTPEWNVSEWADIKAQGKALAKEAAHTNSPAAHVEPEKPDPHTPRGVFKSNLSGNVPPGMREHLSD